jgi:nicotinate-nucleotide adenylyltransferase
VLLVPAANPPHKPAALAPAPARLEMCGLAIDRHERLAVSDLELQRDGPSYTLETLHAFRRERPADEPFLILGWDAAREIRSWHEPERVLENARLVVLSRPTLPPPTGEDLAKVGLVPELVIVCRDPTPDIRATDIRTRAAGGEPLAGLVAPAVEEYIRAHGLYSS